jgi:hypothetical protein
VIFLDIDSSLIEALRRLALIAFSSPCRALMAVVAVA